MRCPACGGDTRVVNSRPHQTKNRIIRRRECSSCQARYTTAEGRISEITKPKTKKA